MLQHSVDGSGLAHISLQSSHSRFMVQISGLPLNFTRPRSLVTRLRGEHAEIPTTSQADFSPTGPAHSPIFESQKVPNDLIEHIPQTIEQETKCCPLIEELNTTRILLSDALDRYLGACLAIQKCHVEKRSFADVPPELSPHVESEDWLATELENKLRKAKAAMRWSRNCSPSLVPIHKLPSDHLPGRSTRLRSIGQRFSYLAHTHHIYISA
ncbi:hypothetical protein B0J17DRAFT_674501 [Rhizoctonia solani]|nr:hypothetical protein B0J17DRAFT_674501 [Rhizoctonia solani]